MTRVQFWSHNELVQLKKMYSFLLRVESNIDILPRFVSESIRRKKGESPMDSPVKTDSPSKLDSPSKSTSIDTTSKKVDIYRAFSNLFDSESAVESVTSVGNTSDPVGSQEDFIPLSVDKEEVADEGEANSSEDEDSHLRRDRTSKFKFEEQDFISL